MSFLLTLPPKEGELAVAILHDALRDVDVQLKDTASRCQQYIDKASKENRSMKELVRQKQELLQAIALLAKGGAA